MTHEDAYAYHVRRARAEFDLAYSAANRNVASAHLRLSGLHMQALHSLSPVVSNLSAKSRPQIAPVLA